MFDVLIGPAGTTSVNSSHKASGATEYNLLESFQWFRVRMRMVRIFVGR